MSRPKTLNQQTKNKMLELVKSIDIQELVIPDEANRKWFRFGAYDALRTVSQKINDYSEPKETK